MALALLATAGAWLATGGAQAQSSAPAPRYSSNHSDWGPEKGGYHDYTSGERMGFNDWTQSRVTDWRAANLRRPEDGYEWREHNGRYLEVAMSTGLIASVVTGRR